MLHNLPHFCQRPLEEKLKETSMWKVYTEIELPLVFTLDSMEKWGIEVKGEELKNYGDQLTVRIQGAGEKLIWQPGRKEFNINSPSSLEVILLKKWEFPAGKDQNRLFHFRRHSGEAGTDHPV